MIIVQEEIHLEHLVPHLKKCYIKLNLEFIQKLLIEASSFRTPHTYKEFSQKLGVKWNNKHKVSSTIRSWFKGENNIGIHHLDMILKLSGYRWHDIEKNTIFIRSGTGQPNGGVYPKFPIKIDEKLGSVIGYILGDGSIYKNGLQISFANTNRELLNDFENKMFGTFGVKPLVRYQPTKKMKVKSIWVKRVNSIGEIPEGFCGQLIYPKMTGKILISIFDRFSFGKHKEITEEISNTSPKFKIGLIRAFFDSEGSVDKNVLSIKVSQNKKSVLEKLRKILFEFNIEPNKVHWQFKNNKRHYYFSITGFYNCLKFHDKIGFVSSKKVETLREMLSTLEKSSKQHLRKTETKKLILQLLHENNYLKRKDISTQLKQIYPAHTWSSSLILWHLKNLMNRNLVQRVEFGDEIVYKLSREDKNAI